MNSAPQVDAITQLGGPQKLCQLIGLRKRSLITRKWIVTTRNARAAESSRQQLGIIGLIHWLVFPHCFTKIPSSCTKSFCMSTITSAVWAGSIWSDNRVIRSGKAGFQLIGSHSPPRTK